MCDLEQVRDMGRGSPGFSRRQFAAFSAAAGAGAALTACATTDRSAGALTERSVTFTAPGGTMDGFFVHPASGRYPGVILWPDIAGLREAKRMMGRRLAASGYSVLVANPYYRSVSGQQFEDFETWRDSGGREKATPWMQRNTPAAIAETTRAVVSWLDQQPAVDTGSGIGVQGYCMTGSWAIRAAAAVPERVKAAASFHGGGLVSDGADSPHALLAQTRANYLIAIARNDDAQNPTHKDVLRAAAAAAGRPAEIEVYPADHGWTVPDSPVYSQPEGDRAWARLLALYEAAL